MGSELRRLKGRREAEARIAKIFADPTEALVVHYSCESFYDRDTDQTPRVTSIAVRNLASAQTESYSIHKVAEQDGTPLARIADEYDRLEKEMLTEFFSFMNQNQGLTWIHWNMRDINYGFVALEHRFKVLGGNPVVLLERRKFDLARAVVALYGNDYEEHPRLLNLLERNSISKRDFMTGAEEAKAFEGKQYIKLHRSTLRKVDVLADILERAADRTLKTKGGWFFRHGVHPRVVVELIQEHWLYRVLAAIVLLAGLLRVLGAF
jgi:uncharacterized protein (DUF433 family)